MISKDESGKSGIERKVIQGKKIKRGIECFGEWEEFNCSIRIL